MARVIAVASAKGGVGKTTTTATLGTTLAATGARVVAVDADLGMANLGNALGVEADDATLHDVLAGRADVEAATYDGPGGLTVVPGDTDLAAFPDADPANLREVLGEFIDYDYVLLDTGAGLSHDSVLPLGLADDVLLVTTPDPNAVGDTEKTRQVVDRLDGAVAGAVVTRVEPADLDGLDDDLAGTLDAPVLATIPASSLVTAATTAGEPVSLTETTSDVAAAYRDLARELTGEDIAEPEVGADGEDEGTESDDEDTEVTVDDEDTGAVVDDEDAETVESDSAEPDAVEGDETEDDDTEEATAEVVDESGDDEPETDAAVDESVTAPEDDVDDVDDDPDAAAEDDVDVAVDAADADHESDAEAEAVVADGEVTEADDVEDGADEVGDDVEEPDMADDTEDEPDSADVDDAAVDDTAADDTPADEGDEDDEDDVLVPDAESGDPADSVEPSDSDSDDDGGVYETSLVEEAEANGVSGDDNADTETSDDDDDDGGSGFLGRLLG